MHVKQVIKIRLTVSRGLTISYDLKMKIKTSFEHPHLCDSNTLVVFDGTGSLPLRIMLPKLETIYIQRSGKSPLAGLIFFVLFVFGETSLSEIESVINTILFSS